MGDCQEKITGRGFFWQEVWGGVYVVFSRRGGRGMDEETRKVRRVLGEISDGLALTQIEAIGVGEYGLSPVEVRLISWQVWRLIREVFQD